MLRAICVSPLTYIHSVSHRKYCMVMASMCPQCPCPHVSYWVNFNQIVMFKLSPEELWQVQGGDTQQHDYERHFSGINLHFTVTIDRLNGCIGWHPLADRVSVSVCVFQLRWCCISVKTSAIMSQSVPVNHVKLVSGRQHCFHESMEFK